MLREHAGKDEDWTGQYKHLFPAMLQLATDVDSFARQLFEPLTTQTIHWLSSSTAGASPAVGAMLEAAMDAVSHPSHSGLRDFGARCLGEFIRYSIKHQKASDRDSPLAVSNLLSRFYGLAQHPSAVHRLGFAYALNSTEVYRELREDSNTLDAHLFELIRQAFLALRLAQHDPPALGSVDTLTKALAHLQRMLLSKQMLPLLNSPNAKRVAFKDGLGAFTKWLFRQCTQPRAQARLAASQLFEAVCPVVSGSTAARGSKAWVLSQYGTNISQLPVCERFLPVRSGRDGRASTAVAAGEADDEDDATRGSWAGLSHRLPPNEAAHETGAEGLSESAHSASIAWLEEAHAALDTTFWTLKSQHLTSETVLSQSGTLKLVQPTVHAVLFYVVDRAPSQPLVVFNEQQATHHAYLRDALKSAFRLFKHLVLESTAHAPMPPRLITFLTPPPSSAFGAATISRDAAPARVALLAALRPTRIGFDASQIETCSRMRMLACELLALLHARQPDEMVAALRQLLTDRDANLQEIRLLDGDVDALEIIALLDGHIELLNLADSSLLRHALPRGAEALANSLAEQICSAPASASPLEMQLLSKALTLVLRLGMASNRLLTLLQDATPHGGAAGGGATRGELLTGRFREALLPHLALHPASFGQPLMLAPASTPHLFSTLLALLQWHQGHTEQPVEPLIKELLHSLPHLLVSCGWPDNLIDATASAAQGGANGSSGPRTASRFDEIISLFRSLLVLGGHLALAPSGGSPSVLLDAIVRLLRNAAYAAASSHEQATARRAERCLTEGLHLLPMMLRWLPPATSASNGLDLLTGAARQVVRSLLPMSFHELIDEDRRRVASGILTPLLDAIAGHHTRALQLLCDLLAMPAVTEQPSDGEEPHPFTEGVITALRSAALAALAAPPPSAGVLASSPAALGGVNAATELWTRTVKPALVDEPQTTDGARHRWHERIATVRWIGLPLIAKSPPAELQESLIAPCVGPMIRLIKSAAGSSCPWLGSSASALAQTPAMLQANLARLILACEVLGTLIGRLGETAKDALKPNGRLSIAYDGDATTGTDCFKELISSLNDLSFRPMHLPELGDASDTKTSQSLARRVRAAAYSAGLEGVVQTQTKAVVVAKAVFWFPSDPKRKWTALLDATIDATRKYVLKASTDFEVTDEASRTALQATNGRGRRSSGTSGGYLPSQALLASSLSQSMDIDLGGSFGGASADPTPVVSRAPPSRAARGADGSLSTFDGGSSVRFGGATLDEGSGCPAVGQVAVKSEVAADGTAGRGGEATDEDAVANGVVIVHGYELDELSTHPLMNPLLRTIAEVRKKSLEGAVEVSACVAGGEEAAGMPFWMHALFMQMIRHERSAEPNERDASLNRRLIIARLAYNLTQQELRGVVPTMPGGAHESAAVGSNAPTTPTFERYAKHWARPLIQLVFDSLLGDGQCFHYLARDLLCLITGWQHAYDSAGKGDVLPTEGDAGTAAGDLLTELVEKLMGMCSSEATVAGAASTNDLIRENVRIVKLLISCWRSRIRVRRFIIKNMLRISSKAADHASEARMTSEARNKLTAIHLLDVIMQNGLGAHDDPSWTPRVRCSTKRDPSGWTSYEPVGFEIIPRALFDLVRDHRPPKPGATGSSAKQPAKPRKILYQPASEVLGKLLNELREKHAAGGGSEEAGKLLTSLESDLAKLLYQLNDGTQESQARMLMILHGVSGHYAHVLRLDGAFFAHHVQRLVTKVFGLARVQVLDCLTRCVELEPDASTGQAGADAMAADTFRVALKPSDLQLVLRQTQSGVQTAALRLVSALAARRGPSAVYDHLDVLNAAFKGHKEKVCRALHLRLLMQIHGAARGAGAISEVAEASAATSAANIARGALLRGLSDADEGSRCPQCAVALGDKIGRPDPECPRCDQGLRAEVTAYWHKTVLAERLSVRLVECFSSLHATDAEERWLHHCGVLLLQLPLDAPNATKALFPPLQQGLQFVPHTAAVPTALSASSAMRPWGSQSQSQSQDGDGNDGPLRATQSQRLFSQTQTQGGGGGFALASTYSSQSDTLGASSLWATGGKKVPPQVPRFNPPPGSANGGGGSLSQSASQEASSQSEGGPAPSMGKRFKPSAAARREGAAMRAADAMRARAVQASDAGRKATVTAYRLYRKGELPDVQITPRDLLAPLQALVHHDSLVAKLTFTQLYTSIRRGQLDNDPAAMSQVHRGVASLLNTRHGGAAFVGCLHELALSETNSDLRWLEPAIVASSARDSGNRHSGILILERHLLAASGNRGGGSVGGGRDGGGKRVRNSSSADAGSAASAVARMEVSEVKMHLAELYRGVGDQSDQDVVRGISAEITSSSAMHDALAAEARGDASEALSCFAAAVEAASAGGGAEDGLEDKESGVGRWERKLARRGTLAARTLLSKWQDLSHETRLLMGKACTATDAAQGEVTATTFRDSLAQSWVRLWVVSHAKLEGGDTGWGAWPMGANTLSHGADGAKMDVDDDASHPVGAPQPRRDASRLLEAGHGSLLLLDRLANGDINGLRALLPRCAHAFVRRWATLHPLAEGARLQELRPLQIFAESAELATLLEVEPPLIEDERTGTWSASPAYSSLLQTWAVRTPSVAHHDTGAWDDLICARQRMIETLKQATTRAVGEQRAGRVFIEEEDRARLVSTFEQSGRRCMLALYEAAAEATRRQGNFEASEVYLKRTGPLRQALGEASNSPRTLIAVFRLKLERSKARDGGFADGIAAGGGVDPKSYAGELLSVHANLEKMLPRLHGLTAEESCELRAMRAHVAWELGGGLGMSTADGDAPTVLVDKAYAYLTQNANTDGHALGRAAHARMRLELANLCDRALQRLRGDDSDGSGGGDSGLASSSRLDEFGGVAFEQVIRAMADGSLEARDRLPSALALCRQAPHRWSEAAALLELPPTWMSLTWAPQLIAMLYDPHGAVVAPLLTRLACEYPQALFFPFHVSRAALERHEGIAADPPRREALAAMNAALRSPEIERLVAGFADLHNPNLRMEDMLKEIIGLLSDGRADEAAAYFVRERAEWMVARKSGGGGRGRADERGTLYDEFCREHLSPLDKLMGADGEAMRKNGAKVRKELATLMKPGAKLQADQMSNWVHSKTKNKAPELSAYSAYLARYQRADVGAVGNLAAIELPGQYLGDRPPQMSTHVTIECVSSQISVMDSLRKPKRITLQGSDQREYPFLCKGGEDLRLDQRVQLVFGAMNRALVDHAPAASRGLAMCTYHVLPLSEHVGLIEWVGGTDTLRRLIIQEARAREAATRGASGGSAEPAVFQQAKSLYYASKTALHPGGLMPGMARESKEPRDSLIAKFEGVRACVPDDLLARAVAALSVSSEVYLSMRSSFARSLAALTACAHVLGIGDRHLDNFLLSLSTGRVVGIDFGHAFGSATYLLPVPELMGVRLTRQLTSFLRPLDTNVLLKGHMVATFEALRARRHDLMRLMEIFLSEPIVDWEAHTRRLSAEQRKKLEADADELVLAATQAEPLGAGGTQPEASQQAANASAKASARAATTSADGTAGASASGSARLSKGWASLRLSSVAAKLKGGNAARLTLRDLENTTNAALKKDSATIKALREVVLGPSDSLRRQLPEGGLTPAQQVDVLVEQATDPNILGRTYQGWAPWL